MSETSLSHQDPDGLGVTYTTLAPSYSSTPSSTTPSSTVQDIQQHQSSGANNLPPFSTTFSSELDSNGGTFSSVSAGDRIDLSNYFDYYTTEMRLVERGENGLSIITSQPQYRPWESKPVDTISGIHHHQIHSFDSFSPQNGATAASKLPSFQSQFQAFSESTGLSASGTAEPTLTTLTNLTPVSPNSASISPHHHHHQSQTLTTLNSTNFHTLSAAAAARNYPLVPAPIQAREIPSIQQQFIDERNIQLYSHPATANLTLNNAHLHFGTAGTTTHHQNGTIIQNSQILSSPTVVTVLKSAEPDLIKLGSLHPSHSHHPHHHHHQDGTLKLQNVALHPTQFQNPMTAINNSDSGLYNGIESSSKKVNNGTQMVMTSPTRNDFRKKERRKIRANSLESSAESDGASSNMDLGSENSGQVAAVSSTDGYKNQGNLTMTMEHDISGGGGMDKQVKKKRKRCGECIGCQRKDNCGDCAPCRNDKSHQICKQRRCEKLTEKKNLYGEPYMRGESRRGRGKGRGGSSYRGRKAGGASSISSLGSGGALTSSEPNNGVNNGPPSSQQVATRPQQPAPQPVPVQQQPMTPMPFYADPNRFPAPATVWQTDPTQVSSWQGQFIQQIPTAGPAIDTYQQYPNGIYQATYQQPTFEANTFYTGAVQVLTPANTRPPSVPNQPPQMIPPRPNSNYSHTPSPSNNSVNQQQSQQQQQNTNRQQQQQQQQQQYQEYNQFNSNNASNNDGSITQSRPSSVNSVINQNPSTPVSNQNYQQQQNNGQQSQNQQQQQQQTVYAAVSAANFSPSSNNQQQQQFNVNNSNNNSGNGQPGYPQQVNNVVMNNISPQQQIVSHNSNNVYPGNNEHDFSGQNQWQEAEEDGLIWDSDQKVDQNYHHHHQFDTKNNADDHNNGQQNNKVFSQSDKVNLNTRIKTMILNKQQQQNNEITKNEQENQNNSSTGHFLWYSHHHHLLKLRNNNNKKNNENNDDDDGGFNNNNSKIIINPFIKIIIIIMDLMIFNTQIKIKKIAQCFGKFSLY